MSEEEGNFFKTCFNVVAALEVENENQAIAKEVVLSEIENLQQRIDKAIEYINKYNKVNAEKAKTDIDRLAMLINADDLLEILKGGNNE